VLSVLSTPSPLVPHQQTSQSKPAQSRVFTLFSIESVLFVSPVVMKADEQLVNWSKKQEARKEKGKVEAEKAGIDSTREFH
jgi:hypothetical protein